MRVPLWAYPAAFAAGFVVTRLGRSGELPADTSAEAVATEATSTDEGGDTGSQYFPGPEGGSLPEPVPITIEPQPAPPATPTPTPTPAPAPAPKTYPAGTAGQVQVKGTFWRYSVSGGKITGHTSHHSGGFTAYCTAPRTYRLSTGEGRSLVRLLSGSRSGWYVNPAGTGITYRAI